MLGSILFFFSLNVFRTQYTKLLKHTYNIYTAIITLVDNETYIYNMPHVFRVKNTICSRIYTGDVPGNHDQCKCSNARY